jgi:hypothetical protein
VKYTMKERFSGRPMSWSGAEPVHIKRFAGDNFVKKREPIS